MIGFWLRLGKAYDREITLVWRGGLKDISLKIKKILKLRLKGGLK